MKKAIFETTESLLQGINEFFEETADTARIINETILWRNLLYYSGEQYIEYVKSSASFRRRNVNAFTPTPVSNEIREYVRSIKAMLMNQELVPRVWPNTSEKEDEQASELGQNLLTWMDQSKDQAFFDEKEKCIIWLCLSGTSFMRAFPDIDGGRWVQGNDGLWKTGDVACECVLPFNVRLDPYGDKLEQKQWVGIQSLKPKEWVEDTFKVKIERADKDVRVLDYQKRISKLVSEVSPWKGGALAGNVIDTEEDDSVLYREVEFKPTAEYPMGRYVIAAGGKILKIYERLPIQSTAENWYYSLTDFHWNYVPGRFWSDAPVSDLISPQNIINEIDQALSINRKGIGRPRLMTPGDVGLKRLDSGGQGFLALSYNPIMGSEPKIHDGTPLPVQVLHERDLQKQQIQDIGGDPKSVLRGNQPSANASGVLTAELRETVESGKAPDISRFNRALTRVYKKRLLLAQEIYTEERLIKCAGRGNQVKIMRFKASDLRGNTDVRLELDSGLISTKSGQAQMMLNMIQAGFFQSGNDAVDPAVRQEVLKRMGFATFTDEVNKDVERAEQENAMVAAGTGVVMTARMNPETGEQEVITDDPLFKYDNHAAHYETHRKFIISPEFSEVPLQKMAMLLYHSDLHKQMIDEEKPDIREYVQYDKLLPMLTQSERAQLLSQMGIEAGGEPMVGLPTADTVTKARTKLMDTEIRQKGQAEAQGKQLGVELIKTSMDAAAKKNDVQDRKKGPVKKD